MPSSIEYCRVNKNFLQEETEKKKEGSNPFTEYSG